MAKFAMFCSLTASDCFKEFITNILEGTVYPGSRQVNSLLNPQPLATAIGHKSSTTKSTITILVLYYKLKNAFPHLDGQVGTFASLVYHLSLLTLLFALQYSFGCFASKRCMSLLVLPTYINIVSIQILHAAFLIFLRSFCQLTPV